MDTPTIRFGTERPLVQIQSPRQKQGRRRQSFAYRPVIERHARAFRAALKVLKAVRA